MRMKSEAAAGSAQPWSVAGLVCAIVAGLATAAYGDGGQVRLRTQSGPYRLTLFTSPTPLRVGPVELSALVQDRETNQTVLDAQVEFAWAPSPSDEGLQRIAASRSDGTNQLLYHAFIEFDRSGEWSIDLRVKPFDANVGDDEKTGRREGAGGTAHTVVGVEPPHGGRWLDWGMPFTLIALFILHQRLKRAPIRGRRRVTPGLRSGS